MNDKLFSISKRDSMLKVYSLGNFSYEGSWPVAGLTNPKDIISCRDKNCLFIKDYKKIDKEGDKEENKEGDKEGDKEASAIIFRVSQNGDVEKQWKIDGDTGQISIAGLWNVLVPLWDGSKFLEFTFDGKLLRKILISQLAQITHLRQAILVDYSYFVLIHGDNESEKAHRVCALDLEGNLLKAFGHDPGKSPTQVNLPSHLVMNKDNSIIIVADRKNERLLLLSSQLKFITELHLRASEEDKLMALWRVCLDEDRGFLIVADNKLSGKYYESTGGRILVTQLPMKTI